MRIQRPLKWTDHAKRNDRFMNTAVQSHNVVQARSTTWRVDSHHILVILGMLLAAGIGCSRATSDEDARRIEYNLQQLYGAGLQYMLETGKTEVHCDELVGPQKFIKEIRPINGEDYKSLVIDLKQESLSVRARDGRVITWRKSTSPFSKI